MHSEGIENSFFIGFRSTAGESGGAVEEHMPFSDWDNTDQVAVAHRIHITPRRDTDKLNVYCTALSPCHRACAIDQKH